MEKNANINTYLSANWNIEICKSGDSGIESYFPFGEKMQPNKILDLWLESMIELVSPDNAKMYSLNGALLFSKLTDGYIQLGTGLKPISNTDKSLDKFYRKTNYIRPNFNRATGTYVSGSGMVIFSRTYDFPVESDTVIYTEAGFEPYASSLANSTSRRGIWSRFMFTSEHLATGFLSGYIDNSGNFNLHKHEIDIGSGMIVSGQLYNIPPVKTKEYQIIPGYRSGYYDAFNNFIYYNQNDPQFKHAYLSGYIINNQQFPMQNRAIISQPVTGYISGFYDSLGNFSGFNVDESYSSSGYYLNGQRYNFPPAKEIKTEIIIGYISGLQTGTTTRIFSGFTDTGRASSGYFLNGEQRVFKTGQFFSGFSGEPDFSNETGFIYSGFFRITSGFSGIQFANTGTGIFTGYIGNRKFLYENNIFYGFSGEAANGFDSYLGFSYFGYGYISGSGFSGIGGASSGTGILTGILGYRNLYQDVPLSGGFSGLSGFDPYLGFNFNGFNFPTFNVIITDQVNRIGYATGNLGNRFVVKSNGTSADGFDYIPSFEYGWRYNPNGVMFNPQYGSGFIYQTQLKTETVVGFRSGVTNQFGAFSPYTVSIPGSQGFSGYIISGKKYYFPANGFSGFSGMPGFYTGLGFLYSGFFPAQSAFSGDNWPVINYEKINGFISGFKDDLGQFYPFQDLYPELRSSGYFLNNQRYFFPTGNTFSGFNGMPGFDPGAGFSYTGFSFPEGFLFSGITGNVGTGILSGFIGNRVFYTYPISGVTGSVTGVIGSRTDYGISSNSGIMTGIFGIQKRLSGVRLTTGEFIKIKYDTALRIPAMVTPIPVTGESIVYGEFNGSGSIKLIGNYEKIFGTLSSDGVASYPSNYQTAPLAGPVYGFWWPAHNKFGTANNTYSAVALSAVMIGNEPEPLGFYPTYPPPFPPENDTKFMFVIPFGDEFVDVERQGKYPNGLEYYGKQYRINFNTLTNDRTVSWPTYEFGGLTTDYKINSYPKEINYELQFKAEYPNQETGLGGFLFGPVTRQLVNRIWHVTKPFVFEDYLAYYQGVNVPYVGWYYRFDNYQTKYEDSIIYLNISLSIDRETVI